MTIISISFRFSCSFMLVEQKIDMDHNKSHVTLSMQCPFLQSHVIRYLPNLFSSKLSYGIFSPSLDIIRANSVVFYNFFYFKVHKKTISTVIISGCMAKNCKHEGSQIKDQFFNGKWKQWMCFHNFHNNSSRKSYEMK